ncbi:DUF6923 family protein, partial [Rhizobium halophytocola]
MKSGHFAVNFRTIIFNALSKVARTVVVAAAMAAGVQVFTPDLQLAQAQTADQLTCRPGIVWLSQDAPTKLFELNITTNPVTQPALPLGTSTLQYNGTAYYDGYLYAFESLNNNGNATLNLVRIDNSGVATIIDADPTKSGVQDVDGIEGAGLDQVNAGTIDNNGIYYIKKFGTGNNLFTIDLKKIGVEKLVATKLPVTKEDGSDRDFDSSDIAWAPNGVIYALNQSRPDYTLLAINPATGASVSIGKTGITSSRIGGLFSGRDESGEPVLFGAQNDGKFYQFNLQTARATKIGTTNPTDVNDGANCVSELVNFKINPQVTKTNTPAQGPDDLADDAYAAGEKRTYEIVASNPDTGNGDVFGAPNVRIVDTLPEGIDPNTVTWTCVGGTLGGTDADDNGICPVDANGNQILSGTGAIDVRIDLPLKATVTFEVSFTVPEDYPAAHGNLVNRVDITPDPAFEDIDTGDNFAIDDDAPPITIEKTLSSESGTLTGIAEAGETLGYQIKINNNSSSPVTDFNLTDVLDEHLVFSSATPTASVAADTPSIGKTTLTWQGLTIPAKDFVIVSVKAIVAANLTGVNEVVNFTHRTEDPAPDCSPGSDDRDGPLCVETPTQQVELKKTFIGGNGADPDLAEPGETLTYELTVKNTGGSTITNYLLRDVFFPAQAIAAINSIAIEGDDGNSTTDASGHFTGITTWIIDSLAPGDTATRTIKVTLVDPLIGAGNPPVDIGQVGNLVGKLPCVEGSDACPPPIDTVPNITVKKELAPQSSTVAEAGGTLDYQITITNRGGSGDPAYSLTDVLDANLAFVEGSLKLDGVAVPTGQISVSVDNGRTVLRVDGLDIPAATVDESGIITAPARRILTLQAKVADPLPEGTAEVINSVRRTGDPEPVCTVGGADREGDHCVVTPTAPDVTFIKTLTQETGGTQQSVAEPGETLTYQIELFNHGGTDATDFELSDRFYPVGAMVEGSAVVSDGGSYNDENGQADWIVTVPANKKKTVTLSVTLVDAFDGDLAGLKEVKNLAFTGVPPTGDPLCPPTGDEVDHLVCTPTAAQVTPAKSLTKETGGTLADIAEPGETLDYRVTLTNDGGATAQNYVFVDQYDANT